MSLDRSSLRFKFLLPALAIIAVVFAFLIVLIVNISHTIDEDYARFTMEAVQGEVQKVLSAAASEITSKELAGITVVNEAKQKSVQEALGLLWSRMGTDGVVLDSKGAVLFSTLRDSQLSPLVAGIQKGAPEISTSTTTYRCSIKPFPLWKWEVASLFPRKQSLMDRSKALILLPLVILGCGAMVTGMFLVLRRTVRSPVAMMISSVRGGRFIEPTGITEFDIIGHAVNEAMKTLREKESVIRAELHERKRVEDELRAKDQHILRLLSCTEEGIFGIDTDGRCTFCNLSCLTLLGYEREDELLGARIHDLIHHSRCDGTPLASTDCAIHSTLHEGGTAHAANEVFWRSDGGNFPVQYWSHAVYENGAICGAVVTFIDMTQQKLLEDQLIQAQKMESVGRLAGGVAHDFNNLLTPIIGYSEFLKRDLAGNDKLSDRADKILVAAEKAQDLVKQLLSFSRKQVLEMKLLDMNEVVRAFEDILRRTIRESISVRTCLTDERLVVRADRTQIEQVLMNLMINAQDAIAGSGEITLETAPVLLDDEYARNHAEVVPGRYLMLAVTDNGCGMDRETRARIFEPFFTTKGIGKGTGLGLATVHGIVRQHGGNIWVYSEPGRGTAFKLYFPLAAGEVSRPDPAGKERVALTSQQSTILVVEDNDMVKNYVHELLAHNGFEVVSFHDPQEALVNVSGRSIDLLVTDVVMPEMTGPQLHRKLQESQPGLKVLYMSGYTSNVIVHEGILDEGVNHIQKPFASNDLVRRVKELVGSA